MITGELQRSYTRPDMGGWRYAPGWRCKRLLPTGKWIVQRWTVGQWVMADVVDTYAECRRVVA